MATKEIEQIIEAAGQGKSQDYWEAQFQIGKYAITTTTYRKAVIVSNDVFPNDDPYLEKTRVLAEKDRDFCQRLQDDKEFRILFCSRGGVLYTPESREEELVQDSINESITERLFLVLTQKVLVGKYFHLLSDDDKVSLHQLVDKEISYVVSWLNSDTMKNYQELHIKLQQIRSLDFFSDTHDPKNPTYPYKFDD